jgi:hypothetical protein
MGEEGTTNTGMGFSGGGAEGSGNTSATTETTSAGAAATTETSTNESSATSGGGGAIPPNTAAAKEADSTIAQSEKGSFVLRYNERTGRNEVVSTMPTEKEEQAEEAPAPQQQEEQPAAQPQEQQPAQPSQENTYNGNEMLQFAQMIRQQPAAPMYPPTQPLPVQPQTQPQATPAQQTAPQDETALAKEYYSNVNKMAKERAMKEIGITQDELDVAEYSDDTELVEKAAAYRAAVENNRTQIMHDVDSIRRAQEAERNDHAQAYQTVMAFTQEMKQKEPNFDAIDKLMISRVNNMPYAEAIKIAPLIQKVQNGTLTTADLPALQEMYNQTRLEFYSKKTGVGLAPKVVNKPAFVEKPGNGAEAPKQTTPLSELGKMSKRDREAAIGQMFSNFFDD